MLIFNNYYDSGEWSLHYDSSDEDFEFTNNPRVFGRLTFESGASIQREVREELNWDSEGTPYYISKVGECKELLKEHYYQEKYDGLLLAPSGGVGGPYLWHDGSIERRDYYLEDSQEFDSLVQKIRNIWPEYSESFFKSNPENVIGAHSSYREPYTGDSCISWHSVGLPSSELAEHFGFTIDSDIAHYGIKFDLTNRTRKIKLGLHSYDSWIPDIGIKHKATITGVIYDSDKNLSSLVDYYFMSFPEDVIEFCTSNSLTYPLNDSVTTRPWIWACVFDKTDSADPFRLVKGYTIYEQ